MSTPAEETRATDGERDYPVLSRAPITEALLNFAFGPSVTLEAIVGHADEVKGAFPKKSDRKDVQTTFDAATGELATTSVAQGFLLNTEDGTRALQLRTNGFTFSRLPQYLDWREFEAEARGHWSTFVARVAPPTVRRVALRFINRIVIPRHAQFEEYFATHVTVGPELPQLFSGVFMRVIMSADGAQVSITKAVDGTGATDSELPVILDIEVFAQCEVDPSSEELWALVTKFRRLKNQFFFGSITAKTRGLYE